jgi:hypothetical protein
LTTYFARIESPLTMSALATVVSVPSVSSVPSVWAAAYSVAFASLVRWAMSVPRAIVWEGTNSRATVRADFGSS